MDPSEAKKHRLEAHGNMSSDDEVDVFESSDKKYKKANKKSKQYESSQSSSEDEEDDEDDIQMQQVETRNERIGASIYQKK